MDINIAVNNCFVDKWWKFSFIITNADKEESVFNEYFKKIANSPVIDVTGVHEVLKSYLHNVEILESHVEPVENNFLIMLILNASSSTISVLSKRLKILPGFADITAEATILEDDEAALADNKVALPAELEIVRTRGQTLRNLRHQSSGCLAVLQPYLKDDLLLVDCTVTLGYEDKVKYSYGCCVYVEGMAHSLESRVYGLSYVPEKISTPVTVEKSISVHAETSTTPVSFDASHNSSEAKRKLHLESRQVPTHDGLDGALIAYTLNGEHKSQVVTVHHTILFKLDKSRTLEELHLDSFFIKRSPFKALRHLKLPKSVMSRRLFGLRKSESSAKRIIIGAVVGEPKVGNSFLGAIFKMLEKSRNISVDRTSYLSKYDFDCVKVKGTPRTFSFVDTRGYFFDMTLDKDKEILGRFIEGLPAETPFSRTLDFSGIQTCSENALSHIILAINARSLWGAKTGSSNSPRTWWSFFTWTGSTPTSASRNPLIVNLAKVSVLYNTLVRILADKRYQGKLHEARSRVFVLVTHMDMIDADLSTAKSKIQTALYGYGIPENYVLFGHKECVWDFAALEAQDKETSEFFEQIKPDEDWQDVADRLNKPYYFPHIQPDLCLNTSLGCSHSYTADTRKAFEAILDGILNYP
jgi:hypothetical protein